MIRQGDWKLIEYFGDRFDATQQYHIGGRSELYNLKWGIGKNEDLASEFPQRTTNMRQQLVTCIHSIPAEIPQQNPHYDREKAFLETREKQPWNQWRSKAL